MVIWLVGMSGAGKTTIGRVLHQHLKEYARHTVFVDGDEIRAMFQHDRHPEAYSIAGRRQNAERIVELCRWLDGQNIHVVCCILCIFEDILRENRHRFSDYFEVYVHAPLEVLAARDQKGLYLPAMRQERSHVVGVDIPFPTPPMPDIILDNGQQWLDPQTEALRLFQQLAPRLDRDRP